MLRDLTVRDLSGTRILGNFTPPAGSDPATEACLLGMAYELAHSLADTTGAVIWSGYRPLVYYRPWSPRI